MGSLPKKCKTNVLLCPYFCLHKFWVVRLQRFTPPFFIPPNAQPIFSCWLWPTPTMHPSIASTGKAAAQEFYEHMNCSLKALVLLCCGLLDSNGSLLFDETMTPWKLMKVLLYHPNTNNFKGKIEHRWNAFVSAGHSTAMVTSKSAQVAQLKSHH